MFCSADSFYSSPPLRTFNRCRRYGNERVLLHQPWRCPPWCPEADRSRSRPPPSVASRQSRHLEYDIPMKITPDTNENYPGRRFVRIETGNCSASRHSSGVFVAGRQADNPADRTVPCHRRDFLPERNLAELSPFRRGFHHALRRSPMLKWNRGAGLTAAPNVAPGCDKLLVGSGRLRIAPHHVAMTACPT